MILWAVEGMVAKTEGAKIGVNVTQWQPSRAAVKRYIEDHLWVEPPKVHEVHIPRSRQSMVDFLNHFAGV